MALSVLTDSVSTSEFNDVDVCLVVIGIPFSQCVSIGNTDGEWENLELSFVIGDTVSDSVTLQITHYPNIGTDNVYWFDDINLYSARDIPSPVPLPGALWLMMTTVAGVGWFSQRA